MKTKKTAMLLALTCTLGLPVSVLNAQNESKDSEKGEATKELAVEFKDAAQAKATEVARPMLLGLEALKPEGEVRLIELVKALRSTGFSTKKEGSESKVETSQSGRSGRGGRGQGGGHSHGGGGAEGRFADMDADGDGVLKGAEIGARMQGTERAKDNIVTKEEFLAAWEEMFGAGGGSGRHGGGGGSGRHGGGGGHHGGGGHGQGGGGRRGGMSRPANSDAEFLLGLDANRDRVLSTDEVVEGVAKDLLANMQETAAKDANDDGRVSIEEYAGEEEVTRRTEFIFARRDLDEDGFINATELAQMASNVATPRLVAVGACLQLAKLKSGTVSKAKMLDAMMALVSSKDQAKLEAFDFEIDSVKFDAVYPVLYQAASGALNPRPARGGGNRGR